MSRLSPAAEFQRAAQQLKVASDALSSMGAMLRAIRKASDADAAELVCIAQTYIDDWAEIFHDESAHFYEVMEGAK
ncbi:hypothetical protein D3C76_650610 [compost metagenome]